MKISTVAVVALVAMGTMMTASMTPSLAWGFASRHPRRAQVLHRDGHMNNEINRDYGHLGGHYGQLKAEDRGIHAQERRDARMNGGHITRGEQRHLNREENGLQRQINQDY